MQFLTLTNIHYTERTILLKYLKIMLDTELKIILLNHRNNYVENSSMISNTEKILKRFLAISLSILCNYYILIQ